MTIAVDLGHKTAKQTNKTIVLMDKSQDWSIKHRSIQQDVLDFQRMEKVLPLPNQYCRNPDKLIVVI